MNVKIIIGSILLLLTPLAGIACFFSYQTMQASAKWPSTSGVITVSEVQSVLGGNRTKAKVAYGYSVDHAPYVGTRIRFADATGSARSAQENLIAPYPVGANVEVYYDPGKPQNAVLEPGGGIRGLGLILPPLLLVGIGTYIFLDGRRQKR